MLKSLIIIVITSLILQGCAPDTPQDKLNQNDPVKEQIIIYRGYTKYRDYANYYKLTIEVDGIKHEYLKYSCYHRAGLTHYPECKYCKKKGEQQ